MVVFTCWRCTLLEESPKAVPDRISMRICMHPGQALGSLELAGTCTVHTIILWQHPNASESWPPQMACTCIHVAIIPINAYRFFSAPPGPFMAVACTVHEAFSLFMFQRISCFTQQGSTCCWSWVIIILNCCIICTNTLSHPQLLIPSPPKC